MRETIQDKLKDAVDSTAGAGSADKAEGKLYEVIGQGKQSLGDSLGDTRMKADGATEELQGKAQQVGGTVQEKLEDAKEAATGHTESLLEKLKESTGNVLDRIKDALDGDNHPHTDTTKTDTLP